MSKLDIIILKCSDAVLDLLGNNDPLRKPIDEANKAIKDLFLEILTTSDSLAHAVRKVEDL